MTGTISPKLRLFRGNKSPFRIVRGHDGAIVGFLRFYQFGAVSAFRYDPAARHDIGLKVGTYTNESKATDALYQTLLT